MSWFLDLAIDQAWWCWILGVHCLGLGVNDTSLAWDGFTSLSDLGSSTVVWVPGMITSGWAGIEPRQKCKEQRVSLA